MNDENRDIAPRSSAPVATRESATALESYDTGETAVMAAAARERAMIEARVALAIRRPRDVEDFRVRLLHECKRPGFAASSYYEIPFGDTTARGWSIRFAETAMRLFGNMAAGTAIVHDSPARVVVRVEVVDYEGNGTWTHELTIDKYVERKKPKQGQSILGQRRNSGGELVYLVEPAPNELMGKINGQVSRAVRTLILRQLPGDVLEAARAAVVATLDGEAKADPDAVKRGIVDSFATLGIMPRDLVEYLGHGLEALQPAEMTNLRMAFAAIRSGETTWAELLDAKRPDGTASAPASAGKPDRSGEPPKRGPGRPRKNPAPSEAGAASSANEPIVTETTATGAEGRESAPSRSDDAPAPAAMPQKVSRATFEAIFDVMGTYDSEHGRGAGLALCKARFGVSSATGLSDEQGKAFVEAMKAGEKVGE